MTYTAHISATKECRFGHTYEVLVRDSVTGDIERLSEEIAAAIAEQAERDGWVAGACPECAHERRAELLAEHNADNDLDDGWLEVEP